MAFSQATFRRCSSPSTNPLRPWPRWGGGTFNQIQYVHLKFSEWNFTVLGIRLKGNVGIEISIFGGKKFMLVAKAMCFMELFSTLTPASSCDT